MVLFLLDFRACPSMFDFWQGADGATEKVLLSACNPRVPPFSTVREFDKPMHEEK